MGENIEFIGHVIKPTNGQSGQINEQEPKWKPSTGQRWPSIDDQESEITQLPTSSKDDYYELIKQSLFWIDINLMDNTNNWSLLEKEWVIKAHRSELTRNQEELIQKLFHIINSFDSRDTLTLQQFFKKNNGNPDLKTVLDLKVGASELTLLHILPTILNSFDNCALVDCFLKAGAEPNIQDYKGKTPLHYYAATYPVEKKYVDSLVSYGADLNIKDNNGKTPLQIAIDKGTLDVAECFFTLEQKKLYEELNRLIEGTSKLENGSSKYNVQGVEDLKKFLDKNKNNEDLKMILSIRDEENNLEILKDYMYTEVINLLLATQSQLMVTEQETEEPYVPHQRLLDICLLDQLRQLNKFISEISKAENIAELQRVVDKAIMSEVRLNLAEDGGQCLTDYILERIDQLEKNYEVASNIVCILISKGARLSNWCSLDVIDKIEPEFKDHKANMIKAHEQYVNCTQKFLEIAKNATNGKLNCAKIDNATFYLEYSEGSTIDVAQITDGTRDLGLTHGDVKCGRNIVKIGNSEVEIKTKNGIRNYTDLADGSDILLTFYTSLGELEVRLYPDMQDKDRIRVEVSNKKEILEKFKNCNEKIGKNCLLGELSVIQAIERGFFTRSGKLCQYSETVSSAAQTVNEKQQLLQDLHNIESNIVKKEKNFDIKTHLIDIFKTLSRFYEEKGDISKTDLAKAAEKESKKLGLEGKYNWNKIFGLEEEVIEKAEKQGDKEQKSNIPYNFDIGKATTDGSCFFDSFRQGLEQQLGIRATVEQLRQYCKEFAQNNPPEWFINAIANSHDNNSAVRRETPDSYTENILNHNRWGDPEVEGRILCRKYGVKLHVVESNPLHATDKQQDLFLHQLIDSSGSRNAGEYNRIDYNDNNVLHIVNRGHDHFEPLLNRNKILAKQTQEQKDFLCYSSSPSCSMDELKIESHQHKALLVSGP